MNAHWYPYDLQTPAAKAVVRAARELVRSRRWYLELPPDRPLPARIEAALEAAVAALDAEEAGRV